MFCAYTRPKYQVSVYRTIGPLVCVLYGPRSEKGSYGNKIKNGNAFSKFWKYTPNRKRNATVGETFIIRK